MSISPVRPPKPPASMACIEVNQCLSSPGFVDPHMEIGRSALILYLLHDMLCLICGGRCDTVHCDCDIFSRLVDQVLCGFAVREKVGHSGKYHLREAAIGAPCYCRMIQESAEGERECAKEMLGAQMGVARSDVAVVAED